MMGYCSAPLQQGRRSVCVPVPEAWTPMAQSKAWEGLDVHFLLRGRLVRVIHLSAAVYQEPKGATQ